VSALARRGDGDLGITALYTSEAWRWGGFDGADLLATPQARGVFRITNVAVGLVRLFRPRIPSLRHSLVQRHALIDALLAESGARQVLELGAGLSRRGPSVSRDPAVRYVEVDVPAVLDVKRRLLLRTPEGRAALERPGYTMVAGDVRDLDLEALVEPDRALCVIAEGLLMYLRAEEQRALWSRLLQLVGRAEGSLLLFDLVPFPEQPRPGFLGRTLEALLKLFTRGKSLELDARTRDDVAGELAGLGFGEVDLFEPATAPPRFGLPHLSRRTQVLVWRCAARRAR
jgi:hypothetical protein